MQCKGNGEIRFPCEKGRNYVKVLYKKIIAFGIYPAGRIPFDLFPRKVDAHGLYHQ